MKQIKWALVKKCFYRGRYVRQDIIGYFDSAKDCTKAIRNYRHVVDNSQDTFLGNPKETMGIFNRYGLDVRASNKRSIELRAYRIRIQVL